MRAIDLGQTLVMDGPTVTTPHEYARRARWRAFYDPAVEASFRAWHREEILPVARVIGFVSAVVWATIPFAYRLSVGTVPVVVLLRAWGF